ncbi:MULTISPECIES: TonB-dependent siderophore receptor [unclassified Sphingomonas]|uniref:TonB-dependent siderophore receptor n=1 Tax=unclassified Sphingomonas TaxID=196159 RepID=UPI0006FBC851|nr:MULTISPECIES: TonB-dependent siderophore receptor [unclassified Sphingomonas]KQM62329.1 ferrisiderophore receptor [Sphingomonas sp. Leaf16]KQN13733.1 ferrisiderophore receptor [Sphingomonas sp. Leaf29]KQN23037.1 ferrisiderophore receptor [Sphingomonas sp. Leaf32]
MEKLLAAAGVVGVLFAHAASAQTALPPAPEETAEIVVTGTNAGTKTETPLIELPQPLTLISSEQYLSQGAINISDTVKYAAGVLANPYGRDTRVDSFNVRGIQALQFRDGMRDIFSYYASITSDPYNFSRVEIVRGPASVLFGQGSIGGLVNLVSKVPEFRTGGEVNLVYGSFDRKEALGDINVALGDQFAIRAVGRVRDADTYVDHVPDDRVMFAPSIRWQPTTRTDIVLTGLYQRDDTGSTSQFLPIVGTFRPNPGNPGGRLDPYTFVGKAGWDRYAGRSLQGGGSLIHRFSDNIRVSLKARYIDSDLEYFTHYADSYTNPTNPFAVYGTGGRRIGLYADASDARMNVFSTDNNVQFKFDTGANIEHTLLAGIDYSWNRVGKRYATTALEVVDLYDIDYDALRTYDPTGPFANDSQKQLGVYVQDQVRFFDRVSVIVGARRDHVTNSAGQEDNATTFRAGIIGEVGAGFSPFFSYTESFLPIAGRTTGPGGVPGNPFIPQTGTQYEAGVKWQPLPSTLVTVTGFHITERNRVLYLANNVTTQSGELTTKGIEVEASHTLPGNFELLLNYGYNELKSEVNTSLDYMPRHTASAWSTKTFGIPGDVRLRLGAGVVYNGNSRSTGPLDPYGLNAAIALGTLYTLVTPSRTTVDALAEITWDQWRLAVNATNLLNEKAFASCLARGDCFVAAPRNVMATLGFRF